MSEEASIAPVQEQRPIRVDLLACAACGGTLEANAAELRCAACRKSYPIVDGVPCFAQPDTFYDEYASVHCPFAASPHGLKGAILSFLPFWSWREWGFWRRVIPKCDRLLDFGCGRGREVFLERARETVGYDGSLAFLRDCAKHYTAVALGQLPRLPFSSGRFDVVVSSHTIGHVPLEHKEQLIAEIARVLKPGGVTAHIIETDSNHPAVAAAKRKPDVYRKQFIEQDGHVGLELAPRVVERFGRHGLSLTRMRLVDAILPSLNDFRKHLDHPDYRDLPQVGLLSRINRWTERSWFANAAYEVGMGTFHRTAEQWFGKPEFAQFILVAFQKSKA